MKTQRTTPGPTALILGITGGYGNALAVALAQRGWNLRALVRDRSRAEQACKSIGAPVELVVGDIYDAEALRRAAAQATVIVHGVNVPYDQWPKHVVPMARIVADLAVELGATILFPGNVYNYAPSAGIDECTPAAPVSAKGALRVEIEEILSEATDRGARLILLRGGDFFGVGHSSSWMSHVLDKAVTGGPITMPLEDDVRHAWCYLPDFADAHVELLERAHSLPADARFHFEGHVTTGLEMTRAIRRVLGDPKRKVKGMPWPILWLVGVGQPIVRELWKMRYLWKHEVLLDESKVRETLGTVPHTPLEEALRRDLHALGWGAESVEAA